MITRADVAELDFRRRDVFLLLASVLRSQLSAVNAGSEGDFEWSCERRSPGRYLVDGVEDVVLALSHADGRSFTWNVSLSFQQLALRDETAIADEVCEAAVALVWRFYRPRFRIGTRRRER